MLQILAALFFLVALVVPLALIALTIQQSGRAILSALGYENHDRIVSGSPTRIRTRSTRLPAQAREGWRAAA